MLKRYEKIIILYVKPGSCIAVLVPVMALTPAEKQRQYRARRDADPARRAANLQKE